MRPVPGHLVSEGREVSEKPPVAVAVIAITWTQ